MLVCSGASEHLATARTVVGTHTASSGLPSWIMEWGFNILSLPVLVHALNGGPCDYSHGGRRASGVLTWASALLDVFHDSLWDGHQKMREETAAYLVRGALASSGCRRRTYSWW